MNSFTNQASKISSSKLHNSQQNFATSALSTIAKMLKFQCTRSVNAPTILEKQSSVNKLGNIKIFSGWNTKSLWNAKSHFVISARINQCSRISAPNTISNVMNSRKNNFWNFSLPIFGSKWRNFQHSFSSKCVFFNKNKPRIFQLNSTNDSRFFNNQVYRNHNFSTQ